jgi:hypothetical protein
MRALKFITGHVIFKLCYNQIYQLKNTVMCLKEIIKLKQKMMDILKFPTFPQIGKYCGAICQFNVRFSNSVPSKRFREPRMYIK